MTGILIKSTGFPVPGLALSVLDTIGKGALGVALLSVGASLQFTALRASGVAVIAATFLKLLVVPAVVILTTAALGASGVARDVAVVCVAVPTGSGAYVLAKQMGGDATLVASTLTCQVLAAAFTLPVIVALLAY
jgi:predicted permease